MSIVIILYKDDVSVGLNLIEHQLLLGKPKAIFIYSNIFNLLTVVVGIPLYHFLIYPFFYNYIPTMLKRIGFSLVLLHCSFLMSAIVENVLLCSSHTNVTCLFSISKCSTFLLMASGPCVLFPTTSYNLGLFLSLITLFEFVFAQTPHSIQGLMTGLTVLPIALSSFIGYGVCKLASVIFSLTDNWFISKISVAIAIAVYLILFVSFSKCYKLRKRDDIVPVGATFNFGKTSGLTGT